MRLVSLTWVGSYQGPKTQQQQQIRGTQFYIGRTLFYKEEKNQIETSCPREKKRGQIEPLRFLAFIRTIDPSFLEHVIL